MIVEKAAKMADMMNVPVLGLVENMSSFRCPDCGKVHAIFGESHADDIAKAHGISPVCRLPINPKLAGACDKGMIELCAKRWHIWTRWRISWPACCGNLAKANQYKSAGFKRPADFLLFCYLGSGGIERIKSPNGNHLCFRQGRHLPPCPFLQPPCPFLQSRACQPLWDML